MNGHGEKLSRKMEAAIVALLTAPTLSDAAKAVGVGECTLRRWMGLEAFKAAYSKARAQLVDQAVARLSTASTTAVKALVEIAENSGERSADRVKAAVAILTFALRPATVAADPAGDAGERQPIRFITVVQPPGVAAEPDAA